MTLQEACDILDIDYDVDDDLLKEQYRWFLKFYHPDIPRTGNVQTFRQIVEAYNTIMQFKQYC